MKNLEPTFPSVSTWDRHLRLAALVCSLILGAGLASGAASAQILATDNLLSFADFPTGTTLASFGSAVEDEWRAEDAQIVSGPVVGISALPPNPPSMLQIDETGGSASQVQQTIDVSDYDVEIDAGEVCVIVKARFNCPSGGGCEASLAVGDPTGGGTTFASTGAVALDGKVSKWQTLSVGEDMSVMLPMGTRKVFVQVAFNNGTIPQGGFVENVSLVLASSTLTEGDFEGITTGDMQGFTNLAFDTWMEENAVITAGPVNGITPFSGSQMLCLTPTGDNNTQVRQDLDLTPVLSEVQAGLVSATAHAWFNSADVGAEAQLLVIPRIGIQGAVAGSPFVKKATLGGPGWVKLEIVDAAIPPDATTLEFQVNFRNATVSTGGCVDLAVQKLRLDVEPNVLVEGGFEGITTGDMQGFTNIAFGTWMEESASITAGPVNGITPLVGSQMLCLTPTVSGTHTQVRQDYDLTSILPWVQAGMVRVEASAWFNSPDAGAEALLSVIPRVGNQGPVAGGGVSVSDSEVIGGAGWTRLETASFMVPTNATTLEFQVAFRNSTITTGGCVDFATMTILEQPAVPLMAPLGLLAAAAAMGTVGAVGLRRGRRMPNAT